MNDLIKFYEEAIDVCEVWRSKVPITKATPNELHLYSIFTRTKNALSEQLACIEDAQGVYMKRSKK